MYRLILGLLFFSILFWGCAPRAEQAATPTTTPTGVSGQITNSAGETVSGAWVYAYRNTSTSLRGPADFGARTNAAGKYFLDLVDGRYYLIARWRQSGGDAGPPQTGDAWALYRSNPVKVVTHQTSQADFVLQGVNPGQPVLLRSGSLGQGRTGFVGRLINSTGQPLPGAFALAYTDTDFRRMPDFTSAVVASDGRFRLYVPSIGGRYCLAARTRTRGQPIAGEPYGLLAEGEAGCLDSSKNRLIDVGDIQLSPYQR